VWGSGVFGDTDQPKLIDLQRQLRTEEPIAVADVQVGGSFMGIKDTEGNVYCWGQDYYKEVKLSKESLLTKKVPKKLLSESDKVTALSVGGSHAIAYTKWREQNQNDKEQEVEIN